ncbi:MAG: hypothetical protein ACFFAH_03305 [Promethearchaeota archaeon]
MPHSICEYCRKKIEGKGILFVNTAQIPSSHNFCSRRCKKWWQANIQHNAPKKISIWTIGEYFSRSYFIRKIIVKKGPNATISYFSERLKLINRLELAGKGMLRVVNPKKSAISMEE